MKRTKTSRAKKAKKNLPAAKARRATRKAKSVKRKATKPGKTSAKKPQAKKPASRGKTLRKKLPMKRAAARPRRRTARKPVAAPVQPLRFEEKLPPHAPPRHAAETAAAPPEYLPVHEERFELPDDYGEDRIVLMTRDPWWIHAYWEVTPEAHKRAESQMGRDEFSRSAWILRVYDVTDIIFDGANQNKSFDLRIGWGARNWYIETSEPGRSFCVDIGVLAGNGRFYTVARSNAVRTPAHAISGVTDEEWMVTEEEYEKMFSGGFPHQAGGTSPGVSEALRKRILEHISSPGLKNVSR